MDRAHYVFPIAQKLYFRACAQGQGFPDLFSAVAGPYTIVPGPDLGFQAAQSNSVSGPFMGDNVPAYPVFLNGDFYYRVSYSSASGADRAAAHHAIVSFPIPPHTSFVEATALNGTLPKVNTKGTAVTGVTWSLPIVSPGASGSAVIHVKVAGASGFNKAGDPLKAFGQEITAGGYTFSADEGFVKVPFGVHPTLTAEVVGPIDIAVTGQTAGATVGGGGFNYLQGHCFQHLLVRGQQRYHSQPDPDRHGP